MAITYYFAADRRIVLLTVFRKQRKNKRADQAAVARLVAGGTGATLTTLG